MSYKDDISAKVKEILEANFEYEEITYVPDIDDSKLTFGNKGLQFEGTVLHIDLRGSTLLLNKHNRTTLAKIHKAYFHTIITIADIFGGEIRSFNGDSMLVFFQGTTKQSLSKAVKAAMKMKYMLSVDEGGVSTQLKKYSEIDYGIGIDDGKILCAKFGKGGDSNKKDLVWLGNAVNKSVKIGDLRNSPYNIGISSYVYNNLLDEVKYHEQTNIFGQKEKVDMWSSTTFTYNEETQYYYYTSYYWALI